MDSYASARRYDVLELLGPDKGRRLLELQAKGKLQRSSAEHVEYRSLLFDRDRVRRSKWLVDHARRLAAQHSSSSSTSEAPDMTTRAPPLAASSPAVDEGPFAAVESVASPEPEPEPEIEHVQEPAEQRSPGLEDVAFPAAPDPPEVISSRKAEVRGYIEEALAEWAAWIARHGVWSAPRLARTWLARIGAAAAEGYGILDHEPKKEIALGAFLGGVFVGFVPVSFLALRRWRQGGAPVAPSQARDEQPVDEPEWGDA